MSGENNFLFLIEFDKFQSNTKKFYFKNYKNFKYRYEKIDFFQLNFIKYQDLRQEKLF